MEKKVQRKVKIRWKALFLVLLFGVFLFFSIRWALDLRITNIYVEGNTILKDQEIIELAGISEYPSFLRSRGKDIRDGVMKSPYVDAVRVKKKWFGIVVLEVEEAKPLFLTVDGEVMLSNNREVPNDRGIVSAIAINYIPDVKQDELVKKMGALDDSVRELISEIQYEPTEQDKDRFGFYMSDGNLVYVTLTKFSRMNYYHDSVLKVECKKGIFNFDSGNHFEIKEDLCN